MTITRNGLNLTSLKKGVSGEKKMKDLLDYLPSSHYRVYNNIMLIDAYGRTTQIDHLVVSVYGLFVVETKNFTGKIYGNQDSDNWECVIGNRVNRFFNPIKQNEGHINILNFILGGSTPMLPVVCFTDRAKLVVRVNNFPVVQGKGLLKYIEKFQNHIFTPSEAESICTVISSRIVKGSRFVKRHQKFIHRVSSANSLL